MGKIIKIIFKKGPRNLPLFRETIQTQIRGQGAKLDVKDRDDGGSDYDYDGIIDDKDGDFGDYFDKR